LQDRQAFSTHILAITISTIAIMVIITDNDGGVKPLALEQPVGVSQDLLHICKGVSCVLPACVEVVGSVFVWSGMEQGRWGLVSGFLRLLAGWRGRGHGAILPFACLPRPHIRRAGAGDVDKVSWSTMTRRLKSYAGVHLSARGPPACHKPLWRWDVWGFCHCQLASAMCDCVLKTKRRVWHTPDLIVCRQWESFYRV